MREVVSEFPEYLQFILIGWGPPSGVQGLLEWSKPHTHKLPVVTSRVDG